MPLMGFVSCSDGDLTIEPISFESTQVFSCLNDESITFLYKTKDKQALILSFDKGTIKNEVGTIMGDIPTQFKLFYRIFSEPVNNSYFCNTPPPSTPATLNEIQAKGGKVQIVTKEIKDSNNNIKYNHLITIKDLVIINEKGERIIESNTNFGIFQTIKN